MSNKDFTVQQQGNVILPDVKASSILDQYKAPNKVIPSHLVILDGGKKDEFFIAVKFDDQASGGNTAKFVGFYSADDINTISASYNEIIRATDINKFVEIIFPWSRIKSVRSLIYKHKATSK